MYPYLKHLIQLWPGDWVNNMEKMNEAVGENNCIYKYRGKQRLVCHFTSHKFFTCIGCIILAVTYGFI